MKAKSRSPERDNLCIAAQNRSAQYSVAIRIESGDLRCQRTGVLCIDDAAKVTPLRDDEHLVFARKAFDQTNWSRVRPAFHLNAF